MRGLRGSAVPRIFDSVMGTRWGLGVSLIKISTIGTSSSEDSSRTRFLRPRFFGGSACDWSSWDIQVRSEQSSQVRLLKGVQRFQLPRRYTLNAIKNQTVLEEVQAQPYGRKGLLGKGLGSLGTPAQLQQLQGSDMGPARQAQISKQRSYQPTAR